MRVGSLFSGIGGFDLAFERAGFDIAWQCEIDKHARAVLARHWPGVPCYDDVTKLRGADIPRVDVLCGGFPCQDISVAGERAGLAGERSGLWFEFHRLVRELGPSWVVIENVPGLRSSNSGLDLATILRGLAELGYMGSWWSPDAQYFGLAQRRERVFIVGHLGSGRAVEVLPDTASLCGHPTPGREAGKAVAGTLGGSSQSGGFRTTDLDNNGAFDQAVANGQVVAVRYWDGSEVAATLDVSALVKRQTMPEKGRFAAVTNGAMVRRLTPTECERLQGFPDGWTAGQADSHRYRQLGNAVAVPVAEWIGKQLGTP